MDACRGPTGKQPDRRRNDQTRRAGGCLCAVAGPARDELLVMDGLCQLRYK
jgi:hypothetical protein